MKSALEILRYLSRAQPTGIAANQINAFNNFQRYTIEDVNIADIPDIFSLTSENNLYLIGYHSLFDMWLSDRKKQQQLSVSHFCILFAN